MRIMKILHVVQLLVMVFTMSLMLSKHYHIFEIVFKIFYESHLTIISVLLGVFSIVHGSWIMFKSLFRRHA